MKKITAYEAMDGKVFRAEDDAKEHDAMLAFESWYDSNQLYGQSEGSRVRFKDLLEWVTEHRVELTTFMMFLPKTK